MTIEKKINDLIPLFNNKQFERLIFEIESNFDDKDINSKVLLILGLARMSSRGRSHKDVLLATQNFKDGYILDKKSKIGLECLVYYLYAVNEKVEQDNSLSPDVYAEIKKFFFEAKSIWNYDEKLYHVMSLLSFKSTNVNFRQEILKKLIDKNCSKEKNLIIFEYIYNNNYRYNWTQTDFLNFSNTIKENLPIINLPEIEVIKKKKIKIGFVSSNMAANHSVTYFIKDLLDYKNENFETHIFSDFDVKKEDDTTKIIKAKVDFFHNISSKDNSEFASFLRSIGIDVLIDLNGYVGKGRVEIFNSR